MRSVGFSAIRWTTRQGVALWVLQTVCSSTVFRIGLFGVLTTWANSVFPCVLWAFLPFVGQPVKAWRYECCKRLVVVRVPC